MLNKNNQKIMETYKLKKQQLLQDGSSTAFNIEIEEIEILCDEKIENDNEISFVNDGEEIYNIDKNKFPYKGDIYFELFELITDEFKLIDSHKNRCKSTH